MRENERKRKRGDTQFSMAHGIARGEAPTSPVPQIHESLQAHSLHKTVS
jgi:hypothetical protein